MATVKLLAASFRRIIRLPLVQFALVIAIVLFLQAADEHSFPGRLFDQLDRLVEATVQLCSSLFSVRSVSRSGLTLFFSIAYTYLALASLFAFLRVLVRGLIDLVGWSNAFGLRNAIARERGIAAYRAWLPFERIRPASIPQAQWEETFAWPANNKPPYPPLPYRIMRTGASYVLLLVIVAGLLQFFTPISVITWFAALTRIVLNRAGLV
jgi:hypothetical protein